MGLYDRDYYREEPRGLSLGGPRSMVANLIIINVVVFLVDVLFFDPPDATPHQRLIGWLALSPNLFREPWNLWQLVTYGFAHSSKDIFHVGFNMFFLWLFGRDVEAIYGRRLFLQLYLSLIVMSGLCWVITENLPFGNPAAPLVGASGAVFGVMLVYVMHYPMRTFYLMGVVPMPAWLLVGLYVAQDLIGFKRAAMHPDGHDIVAHAAHLGGAAFGFVFYKRGWTLFSVLPSRWLKGNFRRRPRLKLHTPERDEHELSERVDKILEKISREGESSLTRAERRTLEDASRRYQKRRS